MLGTIAAWLLIIAGTLGTIFVIVFNVLMQDHPQPWWPILVPMGLIVLAILFLKYR